MEINYIDKSLRTHQANALYLHQLSNKLILEKYRKKGVRRLLKRRLKRRLSMIRESFMWGKNYGKAVNGHGVRILRQVFYQQYLSIRYNIPPSSYYKYKFYRKHSDELSLGYMHHDQIVILLSYLNDHTASVDAKTLDDKSLFFKHCEDNDIATIPILAVFDTRVYNPSGTQQILSLPQKDLFTKPTFGVCGVGASRWFNIEPGKYRGESNDIYNENDLIQHISNLSKNGSSIILQERIINHKETASLSGGGLCTLRVVTGRSPCGAVEHLLSVFRMATGNAPADNFARGGIASPIDEKSGRLGKAVSKSPLKSLMPISVHPDTGKRMEGFQLPF